MSARVRSAAPALAAILVALAAMPARGVFQRCNTGTTQRENVGQMNDSIEDFQELIRRSCGR